MEDLNKDNKDNTTTLTDAQIWVQRDYKINFPLMSYQFHISEVHSTI